jgi:hypothetical protein
MTVRSNIHPKQPDTVVSTAKSVQMRLAAQ